MTSQAESRSRSRSITSPRRSWMVEDTIGSAKFFCLDSRARSIHTTSAPHFSVNKLPNRAHQVSARISLLAMHIHSRTSFLMVENNLEGEPGTTQLPIHTRSYRYVRRVANEALKTKLIDRRCAKFPEETSCSRIPARRQSETSIEQRVSGCMPMHVQ